MFLLKFQFLNNSNKEQFFSIVIGSIWKIAYFFGQILHFRFNIFVNYHCLISTLFICYSLEFIYRFKSYYRITFSKEMCLIEKKNKPEPTIFGMFLLIIKLRISWDQILVSKIPCLQSKINISHFTDKIYKTYL